MTVRIFTEAEKDKVVQLYSELKNAHKVRRMLNTTYVSVQSILLERGIVLRRGGSAKKLNDGLTSKQRCVRRLRHLRLCVQCQGSTENPKSWLCRECVAKRKSLEDERADSGLCIECGDQAELGKRRCLFHLQKTRNWAKRQRQRLRLEAINAYGGPVCACCGETEFRFLTLDHINNDGKEDRQKNHYNASWFMKLKKAGWPAGLRVQCMNCNWGRAMNGGICPHEQNMILLTPKSRYFE